MYIHVDYQVQLPWLEGGLWCLGLSYLTAKFLWLLVLFEGIKLICMFRLSFYLENTVNVNLIRNPILWLGISAYGGEVFISLFFDRRCSPDYFFRNVNKMAAWITSLCQSASLVNNVTGWRCITKVKVDRWLS
jgi:hypothetical protein